MPKVTYITFDGAEHAVTVTAGLSAMEGAVHNNVPGIDGDCGGATACGTCHVYVDEAWTGQVGSAEGTEKNMLQFIDNARDNSRLACQIAITEKLDGLVLRLPAAQH